MTHEQKRLRGLAAAKRSIREMIDESRKACEPYAKRQGRTLKWWKGHFQGLVAANAMLALADYPEAHENPAQIDKLLKPRTP